MICHFTDKKITMKGMGHRFGNSMTFIHCKCTFDYFHDMFIYLSNLIDIMTTVLRFHCFKLTELYEGRALLRSNELLSYVEHLNDNTFECGSYKCHK